MKPDITDGVSDAELAELAALADGSLPADRRADVEARVTASAQLTSIVDRQQHALEALRATAAAGAPAQLRARVAARRRGRTGRRRSLPLAGGLIAATATAALALIAVLPGALSGAPTIAAAAALATRAPTQAAPPGAPGVPQLLRETVAGVPFPNYAAKFGWRAAGLRRDDPSGRDATTVYYARDGRTIAYTIVSGDALKPPSGAPATTRGGVRYRTFSGGGRTFVTWERKGHTCLLSGPAVSQAQLLALADWRGTGAIAF